jgi:lysine decarboxylase
LPAFTQGALVLASTTRLDRDRLQRGFDATHTTSPAGPILASIDAARRLLATEGERLLAGPISAVAAARRRLAEVDGVRVLDGPPDQVDPIRLVVGLAGTGADGFEVEDDLLDRGFGLELADRDTLVATVTMADGAQTVEPLVDAIVAAVQARRREPRAVLPAAWLGTELPEVALPPREAFFAPHETVPASAAAGRVAAELVAPYPPGIPAIVPGEVVTGRVVEALQAAAAAGVRVAYAADPTVASVQVVARA